MLLLPVNIERPSADTSYRQDLRAFEERARCARRWRRRRRWVLLRRLTRGRMPWRLPVRIARPETRCPVPAAMR